MFPFCCIGFLPFLNNSYAGLNLFSALYAPEFYNEFFVSQRTVLDIVFGNENKADLFLTPYEMKDEATGKIIKGNTYGIRTVDENGEVYECKVKTFRDSDKTLLNMLLRQA